MGARRSTFVFTILLIASFIHFLALTDIYPTAQVQAQSQESRELLTQQVKELPNKSKRFALIIGVDEYEDTLINRLTGATNDARALADTLIHYAGFPENQVILLASDQPFERRPTRGNILRRLSNLRGVVPRDGLLLFSFSGHGIERTGRGFLCPTDAQVSDDIALLEATAIPIEIIREWVRQIGVRQVLIILDACRNNPSGRGDERNRLSKSYMKGFNFDVRNQEVVAFATLYATDIGNVAYEYKEKKQGYFTWALLEGMKGKAADEKGEVTLASLIKYLEDEVPKRISLDLGASKRQRPFAVIEGYKADELVIAVSLTPKLLTAPEQISPANGSIFGHFPRETVVKWASVPGAVSYTVEIDCFHCCEGNKWCSDVNRTWHLTPGVKPTEFTFVFVGPQPGRWRVWAVGREGLESPKSEWWEFHYVH